MEIKTKEFQAAANTILTAVGLDKANAGNLELNAHDGSLYLTVTNKEYYVSKKFVIDTDDKFRAVVDASTFLNLISGLTAESFELKVLGSTVGIKAGKSNYKFAMIYDNADLMVLEPITLKEPTVQMTISNDVIKSILNVNSKEIVKAKGLGVNETSELFKQYYINENGCFTCVTGACMNYFTLEKPIKILLADKIVKLFKLFDTDLYFSYGVEQDKYGAADTKIVLQTSDIYVAAKVCHDERTWSAIISRFEATQGFLKDPQPNHLVVSVNELSAAIARLTMFSKNALETSNSKSIWVNAKVGNDELVLTDTLGNVEAVLIENGGYTDKPGYAMKINLVDLKLAIDSYKNDHVTLNCGNGKSLIVTHDGANHLMPVLPGEE